MGLAPWSDAGERPPLAIASCGNAAFAAATLAAAARWPIRVFVPPNADPAVLGTAAGAARRRRRVPAAIGRPAGRSVRAPLPRGRRRRRRAVHRAGPRERVVPRWRTHDRLGDGRPVRGARRRTAARSRLRAGRRRHVCRLDDRRLPHERHHPATARRADRQLRAAGPGVGCGSASVARSTAAAHWAECMWPWEHVGDSAADGILDDETYDWIPVLRGMGDSNGTPIVVTEAQVSLANDLGRATTGIDASHTGTAGLAGLLAIRRCCPGRTCRSHLQRSATLTAQTGCRRPSATS